MLLVKQNVEPTLSLFLEHAKFGIFGDAVNGVEATIPGREQAY
jgi:hypothetical protein